MARPSKYPSELRERAVRMVVGVQGPSTASEFEAIRSIAGKLGIGSPETLRKWVRRAEIDGGHRPGKTTAGDRGDPGAEEGDRRAAPGQRDPEVGVGFLRGGARPPSPVLIDYIAEHKEEFGVEPICRVLTEHGCPIAPSTYYDNAVAHAVEAGAARRARSSRRSRPSGPGSRFVARFGARKMWLQLRRGVIDVARCTVERLMGEQGWAGRAARQAGPHHDPRRERPAGRRTWSTGTSPPPAPTSCGWPTSPTSRPGPGWSTSRSSSTCSPG